MYSFVVVTALQHTQLWLDADAGSKIFVESVAGLGVSGYQLARLLGAQWPNDMAYKWSHGKHRMSSLYAMRLVKLLLCKMNGVNFADASFIEWSNKDEIIAIHRRGKDGKGYKQRRIDISPGRRTVQAAKGQDNLRLASLRDDDSPDAHSDLSSHTREAAESLGLVRYKPKAKKVPDLGGVGESGASIQREASQG